VNIFLVGRDYPKTAGASLPQVSLPNTNRRRHDVNNSGLIEEARAEVVAVTGEETITVEETRNELHL